MPHQGRNLRDPGPAMSSTRRKVDPDGPRLFAGEKVALSPQPAYVEFKQGFEKGCL
jgi:hypothetical protein